MRWLTGVGAGICAAIALLATAYALNALDDWHALRVMTLNDIAALESDPGYPNREANLKSAREQMLAMDRDLRDKGLISILVLAPTVVVLVLLAARCRGFRARPAHRTGGDNGCLPHCRGRASRRDAAGRGNPRLTNVRDTSPSRRGPFVP